MGKNNFIHSFTEAIHYPPSASICHMYVGQRLCLTAYVVAAEKRQVKHAHTQRQSKQEVIMHQEMCKLFGEIRGGRDELQMRGLK